MQTEIVGVLYVVATPIGNLQDLSPRAIDVLKQVSLIACEDTRQTKKLLSRFSIGTPTVSFHQHSNAQKESQLISRLRQGQNVAYVSDAGTPNVSDPGGILVADAHTQGIQVVPIPGPSALTAALSVCGFDVSTFTFMGFVPAKKGRQTFFATVKSTPQAVAFYESKYRIAKTMEALRDLGQRHVFAGIELTKLHERSFWGAAATVADQVLASPNKGEYVVVLDKQNGSSV